MKVIGKAGTDFLLQATSAEIKSLLAVGDPRKEKITDIGLGTELTFTVALGNLRLAQDITLSSGYGVLYKLKEARQLLDQEIEKLAGLGTDLITIRETASTAS